MSNAAEFTPLEPVTTGDISALVTAANNEIDAISADPYRHVEWRHFNGEQIEAAIADPHRQVMMTRELSSRVIAGMVFLDDNDNAAYGERAMVLDPESGQWRPNEDVLPEPFIHFSKYLAFRKGVGRGALRMGLIKHIEESDARALIAEAFDQRSKTIPKPGQPHVDNLYQLYTGKGFRMEWRGRRKYPSGYYGGGTIGEELPVNSFMRIFPGK